MVILAALGLTAALPPAGEPRRAANVAAAAGFCGAKQAFGIGFGSRETPGMHLSVVSSLVPLAPAYRPFTDAEVMVTLIGRRKHTIDAQADFASEGLAQQALEDIRAALLAGGWVEDKADGKPTTNLYSDKHAIDAQHPAGRIAELFTLGSRLYFGCSDAAWKHRADEEMPPPRPAPPNPAQ